MSQTATILKELREAGDLGVHSFYMRRTLFISNPSQRVIELEEMGHIIPSVPEKLHGKAVGARYTLVHDAGGSGDRQEWLSQQPEAPGTTTSPAAAPVSSVKPAEPDLIEGDLGLCLFALPSDPTSGHYQHEEAA